MPWSQRRFLPCGVLLCWMPPRINLQLHKVRFTGQQWRLNITKMSTTFFKYMNVSKCEVTYHCLILNPKVLLQPRNFTFPTTRHPWSSRRPHAHGRSCSCNCCLVTLITSLNMLFISLSYINFDKSRSTHLPLIKQDGHHLVFLGNYLETHKKHF